VPPASHQGLVPVDRSSERPLLHADVMPYIFDRGASVVAGERCAFVVCKGVHQELSNPSVCPPYLDPPWHIVVRLQRMDGPEWCSIWPTTMSPRARQSMLQLDWGTSATNIANAMHIAGHLHSAGPLQVKFHAREYFPPYIWDGDWRFGPLMHPRTIANVAVIEDTFVSAVAAEHIRHWNEQRAGEFYVVDPEPEYPASLTIRILKEDEVTRRVVHHALTGARAPFRDRPPAPPASPPPPSPPPPLPPPPAPPSTCWYKWKRGPWRKKIVHLRPVAPTPL
jgi:hypothetical protein